MRVTEITYPRFVDMVSKMVREAGVVIPPEGDWAPTFFVMDAEFQIDVHQMMWDGEAGKDRSAAYMSRTIIEKGAKAAALVASAWDRTDPIKPVEVVLLTTYGPNGQVVSKTARILRARSSHPRLSRWVTHSEGVDGVTLSGRFVDPIVAAMRTVQE